MNTMIHAKYRIALLMTTVFIVGAVIGAESVIGILRDTTMNNVVKREILKALLPPPTPRDNLAFKFPSTSLPYPPATSTQTRDVQKCPTQESIKLSFPENTLDTSDWLTFRSENLGFEVKYPKDWEVQDDTHPIYPGDYVGAFITFPLSVPVDKNTIIRFHVQKLPLNENMKEIIADQLIGGKINEGFKLNNGTRVGYDGNDSFWYKDCLSGNYITEGAVFAYSFMGPSLGSPLYSVFQQILLSFKLTR